MANQKYDFTKLEIFLNEKYLYSSDCIETLEKIEDMLINLERVFQLHQDVSNAISFIEELRIALAESVPNDRKRI